jgi:general secretion pathway protein L
MDIPIQFKNRLRDFYIWWTTGLLLYLPASLRQIIDSNRESLSVELNDQTLFMQFASGNPDNPAESNSALLEDESGKAACLKWLSDKLTHKTRIQLLIPDNKILHKQLTLPKAAADNLRQVLTFEMDRRTPFTADQVYFDYSIGGKDVNNADLQVELYVTPKTHVDQLLETLKTFNLTPHTVNSMEAIKTHPELNLMPVDKRPLQKNNTNQPVVLLSALAVFLLLAVLYVPVIKQHRYLDTLEQEIDTHRNLAMQAKHLEEQRDKLLFNSQFLAEKQKDHLPVIDQLNELTNLLPDHTWVSRFTLTNGNIQIQGESDAASSIIELMESSEHFSNARFISPVTRNDQSQKDKFNISANITGNKNEIASIE